MKGYRGYHGNRPGRGCVCVWVFEGWLPASCSGILVILQVANHSERVGEWEREGGERETEGERQGFDVIQVNEKEKREAELSFWAPEGETPVTALKLAWSLLPAEMPGSVAECSVCPERTARSLHSPGFSINTLYCTSPADTWYIRNKPVFFGHNLNSHIKPNKEIWEKIEKVYWLLFNKTNLRLFFVFF